MTSDPPADAGGDVDDPNEPPVDDPAPDPRAPGADRLTVLWNGLQDLTERLDSTEDVVTATLDTLSTDVDDLKTQLALLLKKEQENDIQPRRWAGRATRKDWKALVDWVDRLNTDYSLLGDYVIPPCWPAHPGVVEELAGLHRSWTRTMIADELAKTNGGNDLTAWHDRWLWPCLRRLKAGHYRTTNCRNRHQKEGVAPPETDRTELPTPAVMPGIKLSEPADTR
jgi:hypothetical protein